MGGSCEGGKVSTHLEAPSQGVTAGGGEGCFGAMEESTVSGVWRQSREIPSQSIGAEKHSLAREAYLLTRLDGCGLGAEA